MGCIQVLEQKKSELTEQYSVLFDCFDFRTSPEDEFTFIMKAKREMTGGIGPEDYLQKIFASYRRFIIDSCVKIHLTRGKSKEKPVFAELTPPPLVDEMWQLAILYSDKYKELCNHMIGTMIHRKPRRQIDGFNSLFKESFPEYSRSFWTLDRDFTVWLPNKYIEQVLTKAYFYIIDQAEEYTLKIKPEDLETYLIVIKSYIEDFIAAKDMTRDELIIPDNHFYYNGKTESVNFITGKIKSLLPPSLNALISQKFCTSGLTEKYVEEYIRFLTLIYFSNTTLTPSEEVDQVWHVHQALTLEYEKFCDEIFGKFISHSPSTGGLENNERYKEIYRNTKEFYLFVFKENPNWELWPSVEERFKLRNFVGSWISLGRVVMAIFRVLQIYRLEKPDNIFVELMKCYFSWNGKNLLADGEMIIVLNEKDSTSKPENYWTKNNSISQSNDDIEPRVPQEDFMLERANSDWKYDSGGCGGGCGGGGCASCGGEPNS